jgi:asparagine synthase (glutamine-hydrolysing)
MCGIVGIFDRSSSPIDRGLLDRMTGVIRHRGPDGEGHFIAPGVGLGMRRLSIIDLEGGNQPLTNEDGSSQIVFNGEIYNYIELREELIVHGHHFKTQSDTEVIIHAYEQWGADCVTRFNGMFAFALWDSRKRELFLARDHLGIKPLYYVTLGDRVLFGSEIKALLEDNRCPREVDLKSLGQLFSLRFVPSPDTLFKGIKKLPAGHRMTLSAAGVHIERFWNTKPVLRKTIDERALIEEYQFLMEDAVRIQMRSDVPVGLFLSSGVDSSTILALMSRHSPQAIKTFTIGFENNEGNDEASDARQMAQMFGTDHTEMIVNAGEYQKYYDHYLWDLEEPLGNESAAAFYFVSLIASQKVKVALNGQGADEPWAGYDRYKGLKLSQYYSKLPSFVTSILASPFFENIVSDEKLKRALLSLSEKDVLTRFLKIYSFYSTGMKERLFQPWVREQLSVDGQEARAAIGRLQSDVAQLDPLTQMLYIDTRGDLPDDLLMVCDKTSMANSLEARVPFLDVRLVEFIETLPPDLKLRGYRGKYLHKKACEKWLPREAVHRKKKGFANPVDVWFRSHMRSYVDECLLSSHSAVSQYFNRDCIQEIVSAHESGRQNYLRQIQLLISFELWHRMFISGRQQDAFSEPAPEGPRAVALPSNRSGGW